MKRCFAFWLCAISFSCLAQEAPEMVRGQVVTDGAAVYQAPDFDSPVVQYLGYQTPISVSKKAATGAGGLGFFHRVQVKNISGYMADTDIRISSKDKDKEPAKPGAKKKKRKSKAWEDEEEDALGESPMYFTRFVGGAIGMVNFSEKFQGRTYSDSMMMYGLCVTGPDTISEVLPLDVNVWMSLDSPGYYSKFTASKPSGFMMFGDIMPIFPLLDEKDTVVTFGIGLMWTYTKYRVPIRGAGNTNVTQFDSQEFRVGFDGGLGVGHRFGSIALRADVRYYYEKTQYLGYFGSVQTEF